MEEIVERMDSIEIPLTCPDCDSLNVKTSLVKYRDTRKVDEPRDRFGLGVLCTDCAGMHVLEFELLKELLNRRESLK